MSIYKGTVCTKSHKAQVLISLKDLKLSLGLKSKTLVLARKMNFTKVYHIATVVFCVM